MIMGLHALRPEAVIHVVVGGETHRQEVRHPVRVLAKVLSLYGCLRERQQILVTKGGPGERLIILLSWLSETARHGVGELRAQCPVIGVVGAVVRRRTG